MPSPPQNIPVLHQHGAALLPQLPGERLGHGDGAVPSAGAADGDRQLRRAVTPGEPQLTAQRRRRPLQKLPAIGMRKNKIMKKGAMNYVEV